MSSFLTVEDVTPLLDRAAVEAARLARVARDQLVSTAPSITHAMLAEGRNVDENTARQWVRRQRRAGRLIAVEVNGQVLVPTFQLDAAFDLRPAASHAVARLRALGASDWATWDWFYTVDPWDRPGRRPVDILDTGDTELIDKLIDKFGVGAG